jgi:hypothetical protein
MFKKINAGKIISDNGVCVHLVGLELLEYEDNGRIIEFEWNYDPKERKTYIYVSDNKNLTIQEKNKIIANMRETIKLLEGNFEVI